MALTLSICGVTSVCIMLAILVKPEIKFKRFKIGTYWLIALLGAIILFATSSVTFREFGRALTASTSVNPLKILTIFLSMTLMSIFLDSVDFFKFFADFTLKRAGKNQFKLFLWLYLIVSILTVFTSNDIIVLTFTPLIIYFCKEGKINPIPYLITEFVASNTWSMILIIGNPTNIYLASSVGLTFLEYTSKMVLPTVFCGFVSLGIMCLLFRKKLSEEIHVDHLVGTIKLHEKVSVALGLFHLGACIVLLTISSYVGWEMWYICLGCCLSLFLSVTIYKLIKRERLSGLYVCVKSAPWQLVPFVLSMFVIVLSLEKCGFTEIFTKFLGEKEIGLTYGVSSFLVSNVMNNIPMSVFYSSVLSNLEGVSLTKGVYASVLGSNLGALLTPIGALAGIMFSSLVKSKGVKFSILDFVKHGVIISIPTLFAGIGGLYVSSLF